MEHPPPGHAGIQPGLGVPVVESNVVTDPGYLNRAAKDFRLLPDSPCVTFTPPPAAPQPVQVSKKPKRPVRLRASAPALWPGSRVRLQAYLTAEAALAAGSEQAVLKMHRAGHWRRVGVMALREGRYALSVGLKKTRRKGTRRFGLVPRRGTPTHAAAAGLRAGRRLFEHRPGSPPPLARACSRTDVDADAERHPLNPAADVVGRSGEFALDGFPSLPEVLPALVVDRDDRARPNETA